MKRAAYAVLILLVGCFVAKPLSAYVLQQGLAADGVTLVNLRWDPSAFPLPWQLNSTQGSNITGSQSLATVAQQSFQSWAGVSTATITFKQGANTTVTPPAYDGINEVATNLSASTWQSFGVGSTVLAFTETYWYNVGGPGIVDNLGRAINFPGQIVEADIIFNPTGFTFSTSTPTPASSVDFQSILTHEIGHFLGLDHTNLLSSTMFWTTAAGVSYPTDAVER